MIILKYIECGKDGMVFGSGFWLNLFQANPPLTPMNGAQVTTVIDL